MDFNKYLTVQQRTSIIQNRIAQFAAEAYQHSINLEVARSLNDEQAIANAENALSIITNAIEVHETELEAL
jgi:hypothetical protein